VWPGGRGRQVDLLPSPQSLPELADQASVAAVTASSNRHHGLKESPTIFWHAVHMLDEYSLTLRQTDQARCDFAEISEELDFIRSQLARLPTRKEIARTTLLAMTSGAALTILLALAFWH
jgi:hypothetical protein